MSNKVSSVEDLTFILEDIWKIAVQEKACLL